MTLLEATGPGTPGEYFASEGIGPCPSLCPGLVRSFSPFFCPPFSLAVDNILIPENRAHLSPEVQLKELLEKLDLVSAMRSSGARTRRVRLLRREIDLALNWPSMDQKPQIRLVVAGWERTLMKS